MCSQVEKQFEAETVWFVDCVHSENVSGFGVEVIHRGLVKEVESLKERGNGWFRKKQFSRAIECYHAAIRRLEGAHKVSEREGDAEKLPLHALYCNLALCLIQRMHFNDLLMALIYCDRAIAAKPRYKKAYFWKIKVSIKIGDDELAMATAERARALFPDDSDIEGLHRAVIRRAAKNEKKKKRKRVGDGQSESEQNETGQTAEEQS